MPEICPNCGRGPEVVPLTKHHLAVRSRVKGKDKGPTMSLCQDCHRHLNSQYDEREQAARLGTEAELLADPEMRKFGRFAARQHKRVKKRESRGRRAGRRR